jgi:hypothetical protein
MAQIKDEAMTFSDGPIEECLATDEREQIVRALARFGETQAKSAIAGRHGPGR